MTSGTMVMCQYRFTSNMGTALRTHVPKLSAITCSQALWPHRHTPCSPAPRMPLPDSIKHPMLCLLVAEHPALRGQSLVNTHHRNYHQGSQLQEDLCVTSLQNHRLPRAPAHPWSRTDCARAHCLLWRYWHKALTSAFKSVCVFLLLLPKAIQELLLGVAYNSSTSSPRVIVCNSVGLAN